VVKIMSKYEKWEQTLNDYYKTASRLDLYNDAIKAGIDLEEQFEDDEEIQKVIEVNHEDDDVFLLDEEFITSSPALSRRVGKARFKGKEYVGFVRGSRESRRPWKTVTQDGKKVIVVGPDTYLKS
jgi:hypothetical protein